MNRRRYRTIFSKRLGMLVAVAEVMRTQTKGSGSTAGSGSRATSAAGAGRFGWFSRSDAPGTWVSIAVACALWGEAVFAAPPLPSGGTITQGTGTIRQSGNTLTVNQSSQNLAANWQSFDIGTGNAVIFNQPNRSSVALNRVVGSDASAIYGSLSANGKVFLVNPNGVLFAPGSQVSVGGLVASTLSISDADFAAGHYRFTQGSGSTGSVVNQGNVDAGSVALIGPQVTNSGTISTPGGNTTLAAGRQVTVELLANGLLTAQVDVAAANAQIQNHGNILADGGRVSLQAGRADTVLDTLINTDGVIRARSIRNENGAVYLDGGAGGTVTVSGTVDVSGAESGAHGGSVTALGKNVGLMAGAEVNASGDTGGGTVLVGGNWQGSGSEHHAQATYVDSNATIHADATSSGNGGKVVLWSDQYTGFYGKISARGGAHGGNGGEIETSSRGNLQAMGIVDASAPAGAAGHHLLDPADVTISGATSNEGNSGGNPDVFTPTSGAASSTINAASINADLNAGTSVTIKTTNAGTSGGGSGNITVAGTAAISKTAGGDATLLLQADRNITVAPGASIVSTSGKLNITLDAHYSNDTAIGVVNLGVNATSGSITINSNGGNVTIGGGSNPLTTGAIGDSTVGSGAGVFFSNPVSMNAAGGNISIRGMGTTGAGSGPNPVGVQIGSQNSVGNTQIATTNSGAINIVGIGGGGSSAVTPTGVILRALDGNLTISSGSGAITINGTEGSQGTAWLTGLYLLNDGAGYKVNVYSTSGPVSLAGTASHAADSAVTSTGTVNLGWDGVANIGTGNLSIFGQTPIGSTAAANGINFSSATSINSSGGNLTIGSTGAGPLSGLTLGAGLLAAGAEFNNIAIGDDNTGPIVDNAALTGSGNINLTSGLTSASASPDITINGTIAHSGPDAALTVKAGRDLVVSTGASIASTSGKLNVTLDSHYSNDAAVGAIKLGTNGVNGPVTVSSNGGNITLGGGANPLTTVAIGNSTTGLDSGVFFNAPVTMNAAGGNISIRGTGVTGAGSGAWPIGVQIGNQNSAAPTTIGTTGTGTINIVGIGGGGSSAIGATGVAIRANSGDTIISSGSGAITINGTEGSQGSSATWMNGINLINDGPSTYKVNVYSASGPVTLTGTASRAADSAVTSVGNVNIGWGGTAGTVGTGNLTIQGQTPTGSTAGAGGIHFSSATSINGNGGILTIGSTGASSTGLSGLTLNAGLFAPGAVWSNAAIGDDTTGPVVDNAALTASGNINITSGLTIGTTSPNVTIGGNITHAGPDSALTVKSGQSILMNSGVSVTSTSGKLNTTLDAHYNNDTNPGSVLISGAAFSTNGGDITVGGGANPLATPAIGVPGETGMLGEGVQLVAPTILNAAGGNISIRGQGAANDNISTDDLAGFVMTHAAASTANTIKTSGNGNIMIAGTGGSGTAGVGSGLSLTPLQTSSQNIITAQNGNITILGTKGAAADYNYAVRLDGVSGSANEIYTSGTGNVTINAVSGDVTLSDNGRASGNNVYIGWDGGTTVSGGTVTVSSGNGAVDLTDPATTAIIKSANAANAINISAATGIFGGANLTATNNGAISVNNSTSGNIALSMVKAGTGSATILDGPSSGTLAATGAISTGAVTGGAVSIKDTMTNAGSTVTYSSISANGNVDVWQSDASSDLTTGSGNPITENSSSPSIVTLKSARSIVANGGITDAGTGAMSAVLDAHYTNDTNPGSVLINGSSISTKGGDITIGGGANPLTTPAIGFNGDTNGLGRGVMLMNGATLNAGGGNISIRGQGGASVNTAGEAPVGIDFDYSTAGSLTNTVQTSGNGNISLIGAGGSGSQGNGDGVLFWTVNSTSQNIVTAQNGNISIQGTQGTASNGNYGVQTAGNSGANKIYTNGTGNVTINAVTGGVTLTASTPSNNYFGWDGGSTVSGGTVTVSSVNGSVDLTNPLLTPTIKSANATNAINISAAAGILGGANLTATNNGSISATNTTSGNIALGVINVGTGGVTVLDGSALTAGTGTISLGAVTGGTTSITDNFTGLTNGNTAISLGGAINATGPVTVNAESGDLPVNVAITTTNASSAAITLGAGTNTAAPTATGGNVTIGAGGSLTSGAGGRMLIYSGSLAGTTGFGTVTPSASGRFRYGRNYLDTSLLATAPASGTILQYRERPTLTLTPNAISQTYDGTTLNNTAYSNSFANYALSGFVNGDSISTTGSTLTGSLAFNGSATTTVRNVGTYTMTGVSLAQSYGYAISVGSNNYIINPAAITVTGVSNSKTYDGTINSAAAPIVTSGSLFGTDTFSTLTEAYAGKNAGTGLTLTPTVVINDGNSGNNYTLTLVNNASGAINKAPLTVTAATNTKTYDGTGSAAAMPTVTSGSLISGDTFATLTEAYTSKNAGTGLTLTPTVAINDGNGGNNYALTTVTNTTGVIDRAALTVTAATNTKTYDGATSAAATPTVTSGALVGGDTFTTLTEAYLNKNAGTGQTLTPTAVINDGNGGNNYTLTTLNNTTGVINRAPLTVTVATNTKTYDGATTAAATPTVTSGVLVGGDTFTTLTETYLDKNAGTGLTLTPTAVINDGNGGNNYALTTVNATTGVINRAPLTVTAATNTKSYDGTTGAAATPTVTSGTLFGTDTFGTLTEAYTGKNAGAGLTLIPTAVINDGNGGNNYTLATVNDTTGVINKASLTVTAVTNTKTYDGTTSAAATPTVTSGTLFGTDTFTTLSESYIGKNAGADLTLTPAAVINDGNGGNNYSMTTVNNITGAINKAGVTVTATTNTKTYDGTTSAAATPTVTSGALVGGDTFTTLIESYLSKNAGIGLALAPTAVINDGNGGNNYTVTALNIATGVISKAPLTVTAAANTKAYDGTTSAAATPTVTSGALVGGDSFTTLAEAYLSKNAGTSLTLSPTVAINDGNGGNNYALATVNSASGVINPLALTVTAAPNTKTYDGTTGAAATPAVTSGALVAGDTFGAFTEAYASKNAGTGLTLTPTVAINDGNGGNNYVLITANNTAGVINKAVMTLSANAATKTYDGTTVSGMAPTLSGLLAGDSASGAGIETYNTRNAGTGLTLTPGMGALAINDGNGGNNYTVATVNNTNGVINRAPLTLTANAATKTYDGTTASGATPSLAGLVGGDTDSGAGTETYSTRNAGSGLTLTTGIGTLTINDGNGGNNYALLLFNSSGGTITKALLTVAATTNTKTYDGTTSAAAAPALTAGSLVGGDTFTILSESYASKNAGTNLTLSPNVTINDGNSGNNYAVATINNTSGTINQAALTLTANAAARTYDGTTNSSVMPTLSGLVGGDTVTGAGIQTYNTRNAGTGLTLAPGMGTLGINDGNGGNNYVLTLANNTNGVIYPAPLTLTASADIKTYDGTAASSVIPTLSGLVGGDAVSGSGVQVFGTRNAGTGLTLTPGVGTLAVSDGNGGNNYAFAAVVNNANGVINPAPLTVTAVANTKTYDGTTSATASPIVTGSLVGGDTFTALAEVYANKNAGTNLTLSPVVAINDGNGGHNYAVTAGNNTTGVINPLAITVSAMGNSKVYDGTTSAAGTPQITGSIATGDTPGFTETYNTKNVGSGWTLTPSGVMNDSNNGNNYAVTFVSNTGGVITPLPIQVGLRVGGIRVYDATTTADSSYLVVNNNVDGSNLILEGIGTVANANAGPEALVSDHGNLAGFSLSGSAASNYTLFGAGGTVLVSPRTVNLIGSRMYDGTASALSSILTVTNPIAGETVTVTSGNGTLASKNVGSQAIASMGDLTLSSSNYTAAGGSGSVAISVAPITVAAVANTKTYDGTTIAVARPAISSGALMGTDTFATLNETYGTKNAGAGLTLTPNVAINDGNGGNNYAVTFVSEATGVIAPRPLTVTAVSDTKPYDGTTSAAAIPTVTGGLGSGDRFTLLGEQFTSAQVGMGLTLVPLVGINDGNGGNNYAVTLVDNNTGDIRPAVDLAQLGGSNMVARLNGDSGGGTNANNGSRNLSEGSTEANGYGMGSCNRNDAGGGGGTDENGTSPNDAHGHCTAGTAHAAVIRVISTGIRLPQELN